MRRIAIVITAAALALVACGGEEGITPPLDRVLADTPDNCISNVELAFNGGDVNLLRASLATNFVFYFNPNDVGRYVNGYVIPAAWTSYEIITAAANMFKKAYAIYLEIGEISPPSPGATTHHAENIGVDLAVHIDWRNGYRVYYGSCDFEFERYDAGGGVMLWRLVKCWDHTSPHWGDGFEYTSLGYTLALYR